MTNEQAEWMVKFALHISREQRGGGIISLGLGSLMAEQIMELSRIATGLHRLAEVACERELTERETKRDQTLTARAREIVASFGTGFEAIEGNDTVLGAPLFVKLPSGYSDGMAGLGLIVPYQRG